jgi:hypothetical protein
VHSNLVQATSLKLLPLEFHLFAYWFLLIPPIIRRNILVASCVYAFNHINVKQLLNNTQITKTFLIFNTLCILLHKREALLKQRRPKFQMSQSDMVCSLFRLSDCTKSISNKNSFTFVIPDFFFYQCTNYFYTLSDFPENGLS